ncbi:MAG: hypothetical protein IK077_02315 [Thermoguttaceae bacterium]|nr:hypothetical protein [Thermoguttaceae bacterium]
MEEIIGGMKMKNYLTKNLIKILFLLAFAEIIIALISIRFDFQKWLFAPNGVKSCFGFLHPDHWQASDGYEWVLLYFLNVILWGCSLVGIIFGLLASIRDVDNDEEGGFLRLFDFCAVALFTFLSWYYLWFIYAEIRNLS